MKGLVIMAFRNIFRNVRRSLLTLFIIILAITMLVISSSYIGGMFNNILDESIKFSGHVRITGQDYEMSEKKMTLSSGIPDYLLVKTVLQNKVATIRNVVGRIKFGALLYYDNQSKQSSGYGIEQDDSKVLRLNTRLIQGRLFDSKNPQEIIIGRSLAESFHLSCGDNVTLLVRTSGNSNWAQNYQVVGIYDMQNGLLNKSFYISLPSAQYLLDMSGRVSEILVFGKSLNEATSLMAAIQKTRITENPELKKWDKVGFGPIFTSIVSVVSGTISIILVLLAGLGIVNTMLMAIFERKTEIGLLKTMGLHNNEIVNLFLIEGLVIGLVGTTIGLCLGGIGAYQLSIKGINMGNLLNGAMVAMSSIVYGVFNAHIFIKAGVMGIIISLLGPIIPALSGVRLTPTEALRK